MVRAGMSAPPVVCVTGASGFIGTHVVEALVDAGYRVRGTVRDPGDAARVGHLHGLEGVELVAADLRSASDFDAAVAGCEALIHTASAVLLTAEDPQRDIVDVAVAGTRHAIGAAIRAGVPRIVQTSSVAALIDEARPDTHVFTEADWNESATVRTDAYGVSKREAERAARALVDAVPAASRPTLVAICPAFVLGPVRARIHLRTSPALVRDLLSGRFPAAPNLAFGVVDVRDVAAAHLAAMRHPSPSERYLCSTASRSVPELSRALRALHPDSKAPRHRLPDPLMYLVALFDARLSLGFVRRNLGRRRTLDHGRLVRELGLELRAVDDTLADCAASILEGGFLRR
jgi:dihydroflavonol-4-reductase